MRAQLLGQLVAAQFEIEAALNEVAGSAAAMGEGQAQLQLLSALQRQIGTASPATLAALRSEVLATASAAQAVVLQSRATALNGERMATLADVTHATRQTIAHVAERLFGQKALDPYLMFTSAQDEAEYRKREVERQAYIRAELATGTAEGALNAANTTLAQLEDARGHGADRSPEFAAMHDDATNARDAQFAALRREEPATAIPAPDNANAMGDDSDLAAIAASFKAAGVLPPPLEPVSGSVHGLASLAAERGGNGTGRQG